MRENCRKKDNDCDCPIFKGCFPIVVGPTGPTGPTGPSGGPTGPTGATERLLKSSNKIIIDSSLIIPYNEKKIIYFTIFPKKCHFFFCNYFHNKTF